MCCTAGRCITSWAGGIHPIYTPIYTPGLLTTTHALPTTSTPLITPLSSSPLNPTLYERNLCRSVATWWLWLTATARVKTADHLSAKKTPQKDLNTAPATLKRYTSRLTFIDVAVVCGCAPWCGPGPPRACSPQVTALIRGTSGRTGRRREAEASLASPWSGLFSFYTLSRLLLHGCLPKRKIYFTRLCLFTVNSSPAFVALDQQRNSRRKDVDVA